MDNWDEIRTAYHVAREGTVSRAAEILGIHHATVIRHIDALEDRLKAKLFQRHARGYTPTEAGLELLRVGQATAEQFSQLQSLIHGTSTGVSGELVITSLTEIVPKIMPLLKEFQDMHEGLTLRYLAGDRVFKLEYGEAHIAIRAGIRKPEEPDNVVQELCPAQVSLYASQSYIEAHGRPEGLNDLASHRFVGSDDAEARAPYYQWLSAHVKPEQITFRAGGYPIANAAICAGIGLGFLAEGSEAHRPDLVKVIGPVAEWGTKLWLVTHMDLHRTAKVQAVANFLKGRLSHA
ncbi:LysR family transcriptional regulator [Lentibacter sp. XHP0401]|uniref:LysR family transcriptional regulator n=1 Tax=Lentibacter sp. XHP0401 TaxID=2984334 RepID=UPI0021E89720|nr:LysR family transcriptional regulator [Lentibacter sp. XHP0401]MCV2893478.1 LysR family transcriptional regulator [Lentibacter sp. XHP0401]